MVALCLRVHEIVPSAIVDGETTLKKGLGNSVWGGALRDEANSAQTRDT